MSSKVYLIHETGLHNFTPAKKFGEITVLLPPRHQVGFDPTWSIEKLKEGLKWCSPKDYIILAGDPALIGMAVAIAANFCDGQINLLKWDKQEKVYIPIKCDLYRR